MQLPTTRRSMQQISLRDSQIEGHRCRSGERGGSRRVGKIEAARGILILVVETTEVFRIRRDYRRSDHHSGNAFLIFRYVVGGIPNRFLDRRFRSARSFQRRSHRGRFRYPGVPDDRRERRRRASLIAIQVQSRYYHAGRGRRDAGGR